MFCSNCGKQIADDSAFCPECGAKLEVKSEPKKELSTGVIIGLIAGIAGFLIVVLLIATLTMAGKVKRLEKQIEEVSGSGIIDHIEKELDEMDDLDDTIKNEIEEVTQNKSDSSKAGVSSGVAGVTNDEAHEGYNQFLSYINPGESDEFGVSRYAFYDIDNDGVDDLIAHIGTCMTDMVYYIATYRNGELTYFDDILGIHAEAHGDPTGGLYIEYGGVASGAYGCVRFTINGEELEQEYVIDEYEIDINNLDDNATTLSTSGIRYDDLDWHYLAE